MIIIIIISKSVRILGPIQDGYHRLNVNARDQGVANPLAHGIKCAPCSSNVKLEFLGILNLKDIDG